MDCWTHDWHFRGKTACNRHFYAKLNLWKFSNVQTALDALLPVRLVKRNKNIHSLSEKLVWWAVTSQHFTFTKVQFMFGYTALKKHTTSTKIKRILRHTQTFSRSRHLKCAKNSYQIDSLRLAFRCCGGVWGTRMCPNYTFLMSMPSWESQQAHQHRTFWSARNSRTLPIFLSRWSRLPLCARYRL